MGETNTRAGQSACEAVDQDDDGRAWVKVSGLRPWKRNPRRNDDAVDGVAKSIMSFGWGAPIILRGEDNRIIAGHTRAKAAHRLEQLWRRSSKRDREDWHHEAIRTKDTGEVPVVRKYGLTIAQCDALAVADNKTGEVAKWDDDLLKDVLMSLADDGLVAATGFEDEELDKILGSVGMDDAADANTDTSHLKYQVLVDCDDEQHQGEVLGRLESQGFACKPLIT